MLCGDFNARNALWGDSAVNGRGNAVEQFIVNSDAVLLNTGSQTHFHVQTGTSSAIDLTVVSSEVAADFLWEVDEDLHESDHFPIIIYEIEALPAIREPRFIEQRANWEDFREATEMIDRWDGAFDEDADTLVQIYTEHIILAANQCIPKFSGNTQTKRVPWWNLQCSTAIYERKKLCGGISERNRMKIKWY